MDRPAATPLTAASSANSAAESPAASPAAEFSTLFERLPIGAYRSSPDGRMLRANAALVALNRYASEAELLGAVGDIATEWYVLPERRAEFIARLETDGVVLGFESEIRRHRTGERIWISENAHLVCNADGSRRCYEGTVEDISARVQAEAALRRSEERWKLALESTGDGMWDWDLVTGVEVFSPQMRRLHGVAEDMPDRPEAFDALTHPDDLAQMHADRQAHLEGRSPSYVNEHRIRRPDGSWTWVLSRGMVIARDADGLALRMIGTHTDITGRKHAEALRQARDRAEAADRAKSELLSRVSHELRTPLNAVLGFAQLIALDPLTDARHQGWVRHILGSGAHLLGLVEDLLDLSLPAAALDPQPVALQPLLVDCWAMVAAGQTSPAGPAVQYRGPDPADAGSEPRVLADPRRLKQVLANLLSNAVKYNRDGGTVAVALRREGLDWLCSVRDTGRGLTPQQLARLFVPFDRLGAETGRIPGRGIGLALSRRLAEAMGGSIAVHSTPGEGSVFCLRLPAA